MIRFLQFGSKVTEDSKTDPNKVLNMLSYSSWPVRQDPELYIFRIDSLTNY